MPGGDLEILQLTPDVDATYHSMEDHFMLAHFGPKMDNAREEKSATYNSNPMNFNDTHCISFYYRMEFLRQKPAVKFYLKYLSDTLPPSIRYVATASHGKKWVSVKTEISKPNGATISARLAFEAIGPPKSRAGVAIDDILIDQGSCSHTGNCNFNFNNKLREGPTNYLISFYYMMHGNGVDKLELSIRNESDSTFDDRHVISIEAVFKDGIRGGEDISVDDIRLTTTGECFAGAD
ncbi:hypothetical protein BV898_16492 [Hypsibius exemplaris]|uniref:MAM domain-containing protein n=1 Tax=Hypsibius exemplaris TaxID=2072580 RepID=A0A9X6NFZ8_HYPEX|nr:hypothetical protein BV898_16492 [Hypsibius exemplaris]